MVWLFSEFQTPKWVCMFVVLNHAWKILGKSQMSKMDYLSLKACKRIMEFSRQDEHTIDRFSLDPQNIRQLKSFSGTVYLCSQESRHAADGINCESVRTAIKFDQWQLKSKIGLGLESLTSCEQVHVTFCEEPPHYPPVPCPTMEESSSYLGSQDCPDSDRSPLQTKGNFITLKFICRRLPMWRRWIRRYDRCSIEILSRISGNL